MIGGSLLARCLPISPFGRILPAVTEAEPGWKISDSVELTSRVILIGNLFDLSKEFLRFRAMAKFLRTLPSLSLQRNISCTKVSLRSGRLGVISSHPMVQHVRPNSTLTKGQLTALPDIEVCALLLRILDFYIASIAVSPYNKPDGEATTTA